MGKNKHNTSVVTERELVQTLLCPQVFKPYEETLDMGDSPNPDNTDLQSSGSNLSTYPLEVTYQEKAREELLHYKMDLVMTKKCEEWKKK